MPVGAKCAQKSRLFKKIKKYEKIFKKVLDKPQARCYDSVMLISAHRAE